jgi:serine/threonine-protein kinase RIO1
VYFCTLLDPTLTVENVLGMMEKVTDGRAKEVWRRLISSTVLEDISSKCSTEKELVDTRADIYINCDPDSSWEGVARALHREGETAAVEEVRSYLNPRGRFSQWVWFVM